jgi:cytidine deaminase
MEDKKLIKLAKEAMGRAYAPYSGYKVGAALLTKSGKVYQGCNIENSAYSPSNCAERTAIFKAVSEGERDFETIAIVGGKDGIVTGSFPPCGVCRQVMIEFCNPKTFRVLIIKQDDEYDEYVLEQLLPVSFSNSFLS